MQHKSRIEDVALAAGVSTATVSRVLSQPELVSQKTRDLVQVAVQKLGYVPNAAGRALASGRTQTIGCVIPALDLAIFARSTHAMQVAVSLSFSLAECRRRKVPRRASGTSQRRSDTMAIQRPPGRCRASHAPARAAPTAPWS